MSNLLKQLVKFDYKNLNGFTTEQEGYIVKSDIASGRFILKAAPRVSYSGELLKDKELVLDVAGIRPTQRTEVLAAMAAFEAAAIAAKPVAKAPVAPSKATLVKLEAAKKAFLNK